MSLVIVAATNVEQKLFVKEDQIRGIKGKVVRFHGWQCPLCSEV